MNARNFHEYIENPSQLYQISYQELKSLVLQYPYCQSLRILLLKKSKLENHKDYQRNLEIASTYSIDRDFLFNLIKEIEAEPVATEDSFLIEDEVLELKDLTKIEEDIELLEVEDKSEVEELKQMSFTSQPSEIENPNADTFEYDESEDFLENLLEDESIIANAASDEDFVTNIDDLSLTIDEIAPPIEGDLAPEDADIPNEPVQPQKEEIEEPKVTSIIDGDLINNLASFSEVIENISIPKAESVDDSEVVPLEITNQEALKDTPPIDDAAPQPKSSFNSWLQQFESPILENRLDELMEISKKAKERRKEQVQKMKDLAEATKVEKEKKDKIKKKPSQLAKESIREDDEIVSETLAMILESQGHIDRAIDMYERLSLQNPEKSSSFAAKIEELKSQL